MLLNSSHNTLSDRILFGLLLLTLFQFAHFTVTAQTENRSGALSVVDSSGNRKGLCPLKHTEVKAEISGFLSRVLVTQEFENPFKEKIEAVYTFPLPHNAAVDDMTMLVGDRTVRGKILPREEAQAVYEAAKQGGQVASLLDQERPNIFTQSVANILPGEQIKITISYVETLKYDNGAYEFMFPMVVGERYIPGGATNQTQDATAPTDQVPDAARITSPVLPPGIRSGHDVSLEVNLDAGLIIDSINSKTHDVSIERGDPRSAHIRLKDLTTIPNKDFILRFDVAGETLQDALLTHRSEKGGFFTLMLQPPERVLADDVTPKELVFVLDTSGSMQGFPIEKAKETMKLALDSLYPGDTFNLITFAGDTRILFPEPVPATKANLRKAQDFLAGTTGVGGTEMMTAIKAALDSSDSQKHIRIVCFMTDGYVGNDMEIIGEVRKHPNARVFAFGIGSSVNHFLLDKMAEAGRGEVEYVGLNDDGSAAARRFHARVRNPLLTDISIDWNGLPVADLYPQRIPDLFDAKPVAVTGRFLNAAHGTMRLKGKMGGHEFVREVVVDFPETMASHDVLASLWARQRVDDLMSQDLSGAQHGTMRPDLKQTITQVGLEYRLLTQFTSFVAVEEMVITDGGQPRRIYVPIESPEGVNMINSSETVLANGYVAGGNLNALSVQYGLTSGTVITSQSSSRGQKTKRASAVGGTGSGAGGGIGGGGGASVGPTPAPRSAAPANAPSSVSVVTMADSLEPVPVLTPEEKRWEELRLKVHPSVFAVIERLKKQSPIASVDELKFAVDGKAELQVWLTDKSDESLAALKELGFEITLDPRSSKLVIGKLSIEKLQALAGSKWVRYVAPQLKR